VKFYITDLNTNLSTPGKNKAISHEDLFIFMSLVFTNGGTVFCDIRAEVDETHDDIKITIELDRLQSVAKRGIKLKGRATEQKRKKCYTLRTF